MGEGTELPDNILPDTDSCLKCKKWHLNMRAEVGLVIGNENYLQGFEAYRQSVAAQR